MYPHGHQSLPPQLEEELRYIPEHLLAPEDLTAPAEQVQEPAQVLTVQEVSPEDRVKRAIEQATSVGISGMSRAERIAALTAIKDAVEGRMKLEKDTIIENLQGATESKSIPTALGNLSYKPSSRPTKIDEEKLLAYVKENYPDAITTQVTEVIDPEARARLVGAVIHCGDGDFALSSDGSTIDFAYLGEPSAASIAYPASPSQKIVKLQARKALDDQFLALTSGMYDNVKELGS